MKVALASAKNRQATGVDRYAREIAAALAKQGVDTREVVLERREAKLGNLRVGGFASLWVQRLRARRGDAELLHCLDPAAASRRADVVTVHDVLAEQFPQWFLGNARARADWRFTRAMVRSARFLVTSSEATKQEIVSRWGYPADRITTAHLGIDTGLFRPTPGGAPWIAPDKPNVVYVGDDNPRKNIGLVVRALADLAARHGTRARLIRVGPSRFPGVHNAYQGFAREHGVDLVEPGYVDDADMVRLLSAADAMVWPTLGEGFGFPPLEAMACGTPVVALDTPVNREVCGPLARYHADEPQECAVAIAEALAHPPSEDVLVAYARQFTWEACARTTIGVYERALAEAPR